LIIFDTIQYDGLENPRIGRRFALWLGQNRQAAFVLRSVLAVGFLKTANLVGGLELEFYDFPSYWERHHPN